jgi:glycosyltransferase involved in cell wall biosynthesis
MVVYRSVAQRTTATVAGTRDMHVTLIEAYHGGSHRAWAEGYARHSRHQVDLITLPARFWKWRMQGGAATLAEKVRQQGTRPDLLLVSDMVNLPALLGLARSQLSEVPTALYCHENQLTYPLQPAEKRDLTYGMINWLSMLAADRVLFNSRYHLEAWFDELPRMLKHFPDCSHLHMVPQVRRKSEVLPVGCELAGLDQARVEERAGEAPLLLWNQRWEYDKAPQVFFRALDVLVAEGWDLRVALAGSNIRQQAQEFEAARQRLGARVVHYGWADRDTYARLLWQADVVVSTAIHEFFGIAVVEAIYCGCFPVLPRRLAYPEVLPAGAHEQCLYEDVEGLLDRLRWALAHSSEARQIARRLRPSMACFDWATMAPRYDALLVQVANEGRSIVN